MDYINLHYLTYIVELHFILSLITNAVAFGRGMLLHEVLRLVIAAVLVDRGRLLFWRKY